ncbi:hypothetical protein COLO4_17436 [Corchorus olitorius]|uniref:KIB1-4 beta-propeller domain-containing protein n=1 Tax=Corchorus olitorius TaxID=93759 RepID=A0A1R3JCS4_9ROSI|nr:hypothetical protein COLO4_17436 [Corchorus olitorius]
MISRSLLSSIKKSHLHNFPSLSFHPITTQIPTRQKLSFSSPFSTRQQPTATSPPLFKLTHKDWLSPNEILKIFDNLNEPSSLISVLNQYSARKDYKPTEPLFTLIINKLADAQDFDSIENIMEKLKREKSCSLSDSFFQNVIKQYGNYGGRIGKAIETLFSMPEYGTWPSAKTFNIILNMLVSNKVFDRIHEIYGKAPKLGIEIEACTLNILIKGLCENGKLELAFQVLDEFPKQGCKPNVRTFSTLMHGLCEKGKVDEAFELMGRMEKEGIELDAVSFNILISGLRKQGRLEDGVKLLEGMKRKGCYPDAGSYQQVLYGLLEAKRFMEAKMLMERMISERLSPSFDSYRKLIYGFCKKNLVYRESFPFCINIPTEKNRDFKGIVSLSNISTEETGKIHIAEARGKWICECRNNWLLTMNVAFPHDLLLNIISRVQIDLPPSWSFGLEPFLHQIHIYQFYLSKSPNSPDCLIIICYDSIRAGRKISCKSGDLMWTNCDFPNLPDFFFHGFSFIPSKATIYAPTNDIDLSEYDLNSELKLVAVPFPMQYYWILHEEFDRFYLVKSLNDDLLWVGLKGDQADPKYLEFIVFEFDFSTEQYKKVHDLGGCALFLTYNGDILLVEIGELKKTWYKGNCIYYFRDCIEDYVVYDLVTKQSTRMNSLPCKCFIKYANCHRRFLWINSDV